MTVIEEEVKIIFDWERLEIKANGKPKTSFEGCWSSFNLRIKAKKKKLVDFEKNSGFCVAESYQQIKRKGLPEN